MVSDGVAERIRRNRAAVRQRGRRQPQQTRFEQHFEVRRVVSVQEAVHQSGFGRQGACVLCRLIYPVSGKLFGVGDVRARPAEFGERFARFRQGCRGEKPLHACSIKHIPLQHRQPPGGKIHAWLCHFVSSSRDYAGRSGKRIAAMSASISSRRLSSSDANVQLISMPFFARIIPVSPLRFSSPSVS